jgi:hypothetical protein
MIIARECCPWACGYESGRRYRLRFHNQHPAPVAGLCFQCCEPVKQFCDFAHGKPY